MEYSEYSEVKNRLTKSRIELSEARKSAAISRVDLAAELSAEMKEEWLSIRKQMVEISENEFGSAAAAGDIKTGEEKMAREALIKPSNFYR